MTGLAASPFQIGLTLHERQREPSRLVFNSPTQRKVVLWLRVGQGEYPRVTHKVIVLEFVVPTLLAIALEIVLWIGAVYLIDNYLAPIDQAEAHYFVAGGH